MQWTSSLGRAAMMAVALVAVTLSAGFQAAAAVDPINKSFTGVAIKGYDPVAYFLEGKPVKGRSAFRHEWMGAKWYFVSAENRDRFAREPEKYAPQYGGYCSYAVSQGYTADIDPASWKIVEGKLYLNYSQEAQRRWEKDIPGHIKKANENWPRLLKK
jgi:YHS domain-containing protein